MSCIDLLIHRREDLEFHTSVLLIYYLLLLLLQGLVSADYAEKIPQATE